MSEHRCPNCEALITELDCLECVWYSQHENAVRVMSDRVAILAPANRSHCANGHEMTDDNTRLDIRLGHKQGISRTCRTCLRQRGAERRKRDAGETTRPQERAERSTGVGPRQPGGLTPHTLPAEEQT